MSQRLKRIWAYLAVCAAMGVISPAQTFTTLVNFDGTNDAYPDAPLVQATNGDLYGTTLGAPYSYGTIFKMTPAGALTTVYEFGASNPYPGAGLIQATNGDLYGTTGVYAHGTIFRITPQAVLATLYSFCALTNCADGQEPAGLVQAANGKLYGTTQGGGANGWGTVFEITPGGTLTTLYSFIQAYGGANPGSGLLQAANGILYGTTIFGAGVTYGGTIFGITPSGGFTSLYSFPDTAEAFPNGLLQGINGTLYGTTSNMLGGTNDFGTIFKITPTAGLTPIHSFNMTDGAYPSGELIQATNGNLYGTTSQGGANGYGTIFEITPTGLLTTLHNFDGSDGASPLAGLLQDTNGDLYGTTNRGGANSLGTIFKLSLGLAPFVKTLPTVGLVGSTVKILGSDLTDATSVTFNGVPAAFTVVSAREISTTVPTGATTGKVEVVTPSGTLISHVGFAVR